MIFDSICDYTMKKLLTLLSLLLLCGAAMGQITGYPYTQDFESFSTCTPTCQSACALTAFWNNPSTGDFTDWSVDQGGTTSSNTGPSVDHNPGTSSGNYLYMETSTPCNGGTVTAHLESPWFDLTNVNAPTVKFWFHMFGASMGTMHFDVDTANGSNWVLDVIPAWTDNRNEWQEQIIYLSALGSGRDSLRFRIRGVAGSSFTSDMAVDDFTVFDLPAIDVGVTAVDSPLVGGCNLGLEDVWITVANTGSDTLPIGAVIPVCYSLGGTAVCDSITLTAPLAGLGGTTMFQFSTQADFSTPGDYTITSWTSLTGDGDATNDTTQSGIIQSIPTVTTLPYIENFENGSGGWAPNGANASWEHGVFAGSVIGPGPTCGNQGWATNLDGGYNNNEVSFLQSPCIDFSGVTTDPTLRFLHTLDIETFFDALWVETSTDGGMTWNKLGLTGAMGTNWYNTTDNDWDGSSPWRIAEHPLTGMAGVSNGAIRFAFTSDVSVTPEGTGIDDVIIYTGSIDDAGPLALLAPQSACGLTNADTVVGAFVNSGSDTLPGMPVCYILDNGTPVCDSIVGPILPGDTVIHVFSATGDFSQPGPHSVTLIASLAGDINSCNDTVNFTVTNVPQISTFPYLERYENGTGSWTTSGSNTTWTYGTPAKNVIQGAGSGMNAWVTGGLGTGPYNPNEDGAVVSPCFDFSTAPLGQWVALKIWWNSEFSWDGSNLQYTTDDGTTWTNIGVFGDPNNWYTDNTINGNPGGSQEGWTGRGTTGSGGYVFAKHTLPDTLVGEPEVIFRFTFGSDGSVQDDGVAFDDFAIGIPTQVSLGPDTTVCGGYMLGTDQGMVGQVWEWSNGDSGPMTQLINTGTVDRVDTISITYTDTLGLCTSDTVIITVQPAPFVDVPDTTICWNGTVTLDASAANATNYTWSTGDTSSSIIAGPGSYSVDMSNPSTNNCSYTDNVVVSSHPVANIGADTTDYCPGDTVMLNAGLSGASYLWTNGDTTQMTMVSTDGSYSVVVTDTNGCISGDTTVAVAEAPADLGPDQLLCDGATATLDPGVMMGMWAWSTGDTTATIDVSTAGTYSVLVTSALGCISTDSVEITTGATPTAAFTSMATGNGLSWDFTDASTGTPTSWSWDFGDASGTSTIQNPSYTYSNSNNYDVTLIVSNACGADTSVESIMVLGRVDLLPSGSVEVYPNPNNGSFFVTLNGLSGQSLVEVYNLYGQLVQMDDLGIVVGDHTASLALENASKGVYFVKVTVDGKSSFNRIVVQ